MTNGTHDSHGLPVMTHPWLMLSPLLSPPTPGGQRPGAMAGAAAAAASEQPEHRAAAKAQHARGRGKGLAADQKAGKCRAVASE